MVDEAGASSGEWLRLGANKGSRQNFGGDLTGVVFMGVNTYIGNARELYGLCDSAAHRGKHARFFPIWSGLLRYLCGSYLAVLSLDGMGQLLAQGWRTRRVDATIAPRERILYEEF